MEHPSNLMMINGLMFFDQVPDIEHFRATLECRLLCYERFRMKVVEPALGLPRWELDPDFSLDNHFLSEDLEDTSERGLLDRAAELMSLPLSRERPLWEFRLFPNYHQGSAMLVRLHHAIGDGIALMRVLLGMADSERDTPLPQPRPSAREKHPFTRAKRMASHLLHEGHDLIFHPGEAARVAHQGVEAGKALAHLLLMPPDRPNAFRGELQAKKITALSPIYDLDEIKKVGKRLGCTVNDLLMATLAGALGGALRQCQELEQGQELRAVVPVDLRGEDVSGLGNKFGLVFLALPVGEPDPAVRLRKVKQNMDDLKGSAEAVVAFELLSAVGSLPIEIEKAIIGWFGDKASAVVTNLPGPRKRLFLGKAQLESVMYWVPQSGRLALGISVLSYAGGVRMGVASDSAVIPNPELIVDQYDRAWDEVRKVESL